MRRTKQREAILRYLRSTRSHPSADEVYRAVREELPNISVATVYRNLHEMSEAGLVRELRVPGENKSRFDGFTYPHYHLRCQVCGRLLDLDVPPLEGLDGLVSMATGHRIVGHELVFFGVCKECQAKGES